MKGTMIARQIDKLLVDREFHIRTSEEIDQKIIILRKADAIMLGQDSSIEVGEIEFQEAPPRAMAATANGSTQDDAINWSEFPLQEVNGMNKIETLAEMARWAGGTVRVADLGRGLMELGLTKAKREKDAISGAYGSIVASKKFKRVDSGVYSVVNR